MNGIGCDQVELKPNVDLDVDRDTWPSDKLTYAAAMALDDFRSSATDPHVRLLAKLYAGHLCATDMDFDDLLEFRALAHMTAAALDTWTVRDGFLMGSACEAQDRLAAVLERASFTRPVYKPRACSRRGPDPT